MSKFVLMQLHQPTSMHQIAAFTSIPPDFFTFVSGDLWKLLKKKFMFSAVFPTDM